MREVLTVLWKEFKELKSLQGTRLGLTRLAIVMGLIGVVFPLQNGPSWLRTPASMLVCGWISLFMTATIIADTFAGERERHTLETLLAMPLSDRSILLGKIATGVLYGWGLGMATFLLAILALSLSAGHGWLLPRPLNGIGTVALGFLGAWLAAGIGVLVSLKASTVRQAYQTLNISFLLLILVPSFGIPLIPLEIRRQAGKAFSSVGDVTLLVAALALLLITDLVLTAVASQRFRRDRLIVD